jgi:hypothetical protein
MPAPVVAPTLTPPVAIAPAPAQKNVVQTQDDHPVPPASIPLETVAAPKTTTDESSRSRIGKWISAIPLLGTVMDNARH